jgi:hypothetical protein
MIAGIVVGAILAIACVVLVAIPFLRDPAPASDALNELGPDQLRLVELAEERDRALAALKELEADHRGGRIADADYRALVGPLRREAAEALRALDEDPRQAEEPTSDPVTTLGA